MNFAYKEFRFGKSLLVITEQYHIESDRVISDNVGFYVYEIPAYLLDKEAVAVAEIKDKSECTFYTVASKAAAKIKNIEGPQSPICTERVKQLREQVLAPVQYRVKEHAFMTSAANLARLLTLKAQEAGIRIRLRPETFIDNYNEEDSYFKIELSNNEGFKVDLDDILNGTKN